MMIRRFLPRKRCICGVDGRCQTLVQSMVVITAALMLCGCSRDIAGVKPRLRATADTSLLTPDVAQKLILGGMFALAGPQAPDELSEMRVREIARVWVRQ